MSWGRWTNNVLAENLDGGTYWGLPHLTGAPHLSTRAGIDANYGPVWELCLVVCENVASSVVDPFYS